MDHKVSKDMISSGMIPSGEKTQADLSRTQYGSAPSPSKLMDAYKSMYEHHKKDADGNTIPHEGEQLNEAGPLAALVPLLGKIGAGTAAKGAAAGATKAAAASATKAAAGSTIAKGGLGQTVTRAGIKLGGKTGGKVAQGAVDYAKSDVGKIDMLNRAGSSVNQEKEKVSKTAMVTAGADLFDIIKGQLLDEGLSEEEIKDIMLTLTPDEIMEELSDVVKRNDALNRERAMKAAQERKVPDKVREASKRQYTAGGPKDTGANKYTTQDKKTIIDYNKNKESM